MLKRKISKDSFEALSTEGKGYYKADGESYVLDVEPIEGLEGMKKAKDREVEARKALKAENDALIAARDELLAKATADTDENSRKSGDVEALENSWKAKNKELKETLSGQRDGYKSQLENLLIHGAAKSLADEISTSPSLLMRPILDRLSVGYDGDVPTTRILDAKGQPSALTMDEFKDELLSNKEYSPILKGSKARGGDSQKSFIPNLGGGAPGNNTGKSPLEMNPAEFVNHMKSKETT